MAKKQKKALFTAWKVLFITWTVSFLHNLLCLNSIWIFIALHKKILFEKFVFNPILPKKKLRSSSHSKKCTNEIHFCVSVNLLIFGSIFHLEICIFVWPTTFQLIALTIYEVLIKAFNYFHLFTPLLIC